MNNRQRLVFSLVFFLFSTLFSGCKTNPNSFESGEVIAVSSSIAPQTLIPIGKSVGVTLSTKGVVVAGISETINQSKSPAKKAGLRQGDVIIAFDGQNVNNVEELSKAVSESQSTPSSITVIREKKNVELMITPTLSQSEQKKVIGAWVKDAASGIGTLTFFDPKTMRFAALGHGICDTETGSILDIDSGTILSSTIVSVDKGEKGSPGELNGVFSESGTKLGEITENFDFGICGKISKDCKLDGQPIPIAKKDEITQGKATIMTNVEGNLVETFDIEILRILPHGNTATKNMVIKITDPDLLKKTGGIVQGMSGSPILKDGKLVGAVTHVFVNDPTRGYGIFIENMLSNTH